MPSVRVINIEKDDERVIGALVLKDGKISIVGTKNEKDKRALEYMLNFSLPGIIAGRRGTRIDAKSDPLTFLRFLPVEYDGSRTRVEYIE